MSSVRQRVREEGFGLAVIALSFVLPWLITTVADAAGLLLCFAIATRVIAILGGI